MAKEKEKSEDVVMVEMVGGFKQTRVPPRLFQGSIQMLAAPEWP